MQKVIFVLSAFLLLGFSKPVPQAKLTVELKGIREVKGKVFVAIFRKKDDFPAERGQFKGVISEVKTKNTTVVLEDLPPDTYSVAAFHDANGNGKMDKNIFGVPTEVYGFSNDARNTFSAPSFESASFELKSERKIVIHLK